jgi:outer membrane lipoprotein-sorting protein
MKRFFGAALTLAICAVLFSSCNAVGKGIDVEDSSSGYEKAHKMLADLKTFKAEANVKYISNKNENEYETLQHGKITGEYRVEVTGPEKVSGTVTIFDGKQIAQFNPKLGGKVVVSENESAERSEIFLTSFIKNYFMSNEVSVSAAKLDEAKCTVLEAVVPGGHHFIATEKLWVSNKTKKPLQLVIYDQDGGERIIVTYNTFSYNIDIDDSIFKTN